MGSLPAQFQGIFCTKKSLLVRVRSRELYTKADASTAIQYVMRIHCVVCHLQQIEIAVLDMFPRSLWSGYIRFERRIRRPTLVD